MLTPGGSRLNNSGVKQAMWIEAFGYPTCDYCGNKSYILDVRKEIFDVKESKIMFLLYCKCLNCGNEFHKIISNAAIEHKTYREINDLLDKMGGLKNE